MKDFLLLGVEKKISNTTITEPKKKKNLSSSQPKKK
jgi:hypothetical protein